MPPRLALGERGKGKSGDLFLDGLDGSGYFTVDEYSFITEYGFAENARDAMGLLCERGRVICKENAVKILSAL